MHARYWIAPGLAVLSPAIASLAIAPGWVSSRSSQFVAAEIVRCADIVKLSGAKVE